MLRTCGSTPRRSRTSSTRARGRRTTRSCAVTTSSTQLRANLTELHGRPTAPDQTLVVERLDVFLSVTSVVSNTAQRGARSHCAGHRTADRRPDPPPQARRPCSTSSRPTRADDLAVAARSTAAFPVAFEPLRVGRDELVGRHRLPARTARSPPALRWRRHRQHAGREGGAAPSSSAPADGPTDRLLLYLHPSPGVPDAAAAKQALVSRAGPRRARCPPVRRAPHDHPLTAHQVIARRSAGHRSAQRDASSSSSPTATGCSHRWPGRPTGGTSGETRRRRRARARARRRPPRRSVRVTVGARRRAHPARRVRAAGRWTQRREVERLVRLLAQELAASTLPHAADLPTLSRNSLRPWGAAIRTASLLIEWCQCAGDDARVVDAAGQKKLRLYELRDRAVRTAADAQRRDARAIPELPQDDAARDACSCSNARRR